VFGVVVYREGDLTISQFQNEQEFSAFRDSLA
jgi:hypothetical protein